MKNNIYTINAEEKTLGRVASEVAKILMGKNSPNYTPNLKPTNMVIIENASKTKTTEKRILKTQHERYSGYPGGFKEHTYQQVMATHPERILENAVAGMIPDNRLKDPRLLRLKVVVGDKNPYEKLMK